MAIAASAIQTALYSRLTGDATLMGLITGVFDAVPDAQAFPYLTLGEFEGSEWSTFGTLGQTYLFTLHTWSQSKGTKAAQAIQSRVDTLLHRVTLSLSGAACVTCVREFDTVLRDPDGVTWHGVQRFRMWVTAT